MDCGVVALIGDHVDCWVERSPFLFLAFSFLLSLGPSHSLAPLLPSNWAHTPPTLDSPSLLAYLYSSCTGSRSRCFSSFSFPWISGLVVTGVFVFRDKYLSFHFDYIFFDFIITMGADGGSIPRRDELVKQKQRAVRHDPALLATLVWFYCALSKEPLREPIVACALGRMYNRESILQHLLDPTRFGDMAQSVSHITSLRDVIGLQLSPYRADQNTTDGGAGGGEKVGALVGAAPDAQRPQFACPLSGAAMNGLGGRRFVAVRPCGCVVAERAFLDLVVTGTTKAAANADAADTAAACCPVCATPMVKSPMTPVVVLNPPAEEVPEMVARDRAEKAARKADRKKAKTKGSETEDGSAKKQRKRSRAKATEADGEQDQAAGEDDADQPPAAKRAHVDLPPAATAGINLSLPSVPVPKPASAAIASLYAKKTDPRASSTTDNSNFFVRGTYSRGNG